MRKLQNFKDDEKNKCILLLIKLLEGVVFTGTDLLEIYETLKMLICKCKIKLPVV